MLASSISAFQTMKMSVGPSSSHTHGPMLIGNMFRRFIASNAEGLEFARVRIVLFWSLARTGKGHMTDNAIVAGLMGLDPVKDDLELINTALERVCEAGKIDMGVRTVPFDVKKDIVWKPNRRLPGHENGLTLSLMDAKRKPLISRNYYSVGGGMVQDESYEEGNPTLVEYPYQFAKKWMEYAHEFHLPLSEIVKQNTAALEHMTVEEVTIRMGHIWTTMKTCIQRGVNPSSNTLPGSLKLHRRAPQLLEAAHRPKRRGIFASNDICRYATAFAYAVSEENAASGRVVTAPTNGGAGVLPGVLYAAQYLDDFSDAQIVEVLFTAAGIGGLIQANASISGSEVGCQGEVGAACAMAAGAVCQLFEGTVSDTEYAAEIAMEHSLGLECTPMKGYVQIPCIERNGIYAQKALAAAQHAITLKHHRISLDLVINRMYENGKHMDPDFKETSRKGFGPIEPDLEPFHV